MALSVARKQELARMTLPSDEDTRRRVRLFLGQSGMTVSEFADALGRGTSSVNLFLQNRYDAHHEKDSNTLAIRAAMKQFMDLHELSDSVALRGTHHDTRSFLEVRRATVAALQQGVAYIVDGPPGTEKTWSLLQAGKHIKEHGLGRFVYIYTRVDHSPQSFLREICCSAGIPNRGNIDQLIRKIRFFLADGRTVLAVDEGQHLNHACLEVLRQLLDQPPFFGVVIAGSHDLTQRLSHWQMEQWRSRVRKTIFLNGPDQAECRRILRAEFGNVTDAQCDATIASCVSTAARVEIKNGKPVEVRFEYHSARLLFDGIGSARKSIASQTLAQQQGAA